MTINLLKNDINLKTKICEIIYDQPCFEHESKDSLKGLLTNMKQINQILNELEKRREKIKFIYLNRRAIETILYNEEVTIEIKESDINNQMANLFYLCLLIDSHPDLVNYTYNRDLILSIQEKIEKENKNKIKKIVLSKMLVLLINRVKLERCTTVRGSKKNRKKCKICISMRFMVIMREWKIVMRMKKEKI